MATLVSEAGGRFVEAAVMSPIDPRRLSAPILLAGVAAADFLPLAEALGFSAMRVCSSEFGRAAATKMCRSVVIKGMEALLTESLLAARHYGVENDVLESISNLLPLPNWQAHAHYMISRSIEHGLRRAEEMQQVAETVAQADIQPHMSSSCVERQAWAAQFSTALEQPDLHSMLDGILVNIQE
jgi:3-hydroxyisobutyrate dehydrogenase-like beta-hydroxyacid dehydrogenase